jgi:putative ABC transport system permease protein
LGGPTLRRLSATVLFGDDPKTIVGVFEDFNFRSLHHPVQPLVLNYYDFRMYLSLRIARTAVQKTIDHMRSTWARFSPGFPFDFYFLNRRLAEQYRAEQRIDELFKIFAALSLLVGCLGLFGLSAFTAERRAKEVGIRKALGATISELVRMFSAEYTKLLLVAWMLATPVAWYAARSWLQNFAYQAEVGVWPYLTAGLLTLLFAWITVSYHSLKAASANPVETLRYE